ncbi:MAG: DEAD/DEAH box helicase [Candidatus Brocadiaceae bacterium]|nr:DEAD/DEAH box helicase [Candidatus Brocadiaceae bacterium]
MKFSELGLPLNILKTLEKMGYEEMTPIQEATYPVIFAGKDLCALAETGSGKTAACAIPLIQKVDPSNNAIQGLVIVPTRELCLQYVAEIKKIAERTPVIPYAVYGGFDKQFQISRLKQEIHILVATPGRLIDLLYDGALSFSQVKCAILDEADELLKVGFLEDIEFIMSCILHEHQTLLFSATMPDDIKKLAHDCLRDPQHISLITKRAAPESIEHYFSYLHPKQKQEKLIQYLEGEDVNQVIIFCNARHMVDKLFRSMRKDFKEIEYIHAGLTQDKRSSIFMRFKKEKVRYLIASDVAGRGLDFSHISHVINWNFPLNSEQYTHRTGRAGRMGRKGKAFTFVTKHEIPNLRELLLKKKITPCWIGKDPFHENNTFLKQKNQKRKRPFHSHTGKNKKKTE